MAYHLKGAEWYNWESKEDVGGKRVGEGWREAHLNSF